MYSPDVPLSQIIEEGVAVVQSSRHKEVAMDLMLYSGDKHFTKISLFIVPLHLVVSSASGV